jgi:hypothetical protein
MRRKSAPFATNPWVRVPASPRARARLRALLDRRHHFVLPGFIRPEFAAKLAALGRKEGFRPASYKTGREDRARGRAAASLIEGMLFNDEVLEFMRYVSRDPELVAARGRVYRMRRSSRHGLFWHNDLKPGRAIALSIDLSPEKFEGGDLEMRTTPGRKPLVRVRNASLGSALFFRVRRGLEHRVLPVGGENPKVAFAGWFLRALSAPRRR